MTERGSSSRERFISRMASWWRPRAASWTALHAVRAFVTGVQRNGLLNVSLLRFPIPHVQVEISQAHAAIGKRGIQLDSLLSGMANFGPTLFRPKDIGDDQESVGIGDASPRGKKIGIRSDGFLEVGSRLAESVLGELIEEVATLKVSIVGQWIRWNG